MRHKKKQSFIKYNQYLLLIDYYPVLLFKLFINYYYLKFFKHQKSLYLIIYYRYELNN